MEQLTQPGAFFTGNPDCEIVHDFIAASNLSAYTNTAIAGGSAAAVVAGASGIVRFTGAATTDASGAQLQIPNTAIDLEPKATAQMVIRHNVGVIASEWEFGFAGLDTSIIASDPTNGIWLHKTKGTNEVKLSVVRGGVADTRTLGLIDKPGQMVVWGLQVNARGDTSRIAEVVVYRDGKSVYVADGRVNDLFTNVPDDAFLTPSYVFQSGSAVGTQVCDLDYNRCRFSRK